MMKSRAVEQGFRSALESCPDVVAQTRPTVAVIMAVHNEISHIERVASEVLAQDYPAIEEIWFVDGGSTDGTVAALHSIARRDGRVRILDNKKKHTAAGINLALQQVRADVFVRLDAHASYAPDVVSESIAALLATDAGGVGAIARPVAPNRPAPRAIEAAHRSRLGVGVARFRQADAEGWVDTVWNGSYWFHVAKEVGLLNEDLWRAEDNDFNERVRRAGYGLFLSPRIKATYQPRQTLAALWKQYFDNGTGVVLAWVQNRRAVRLRHLVPMMFVSGLLFLTAAAIYWPETRYLLFFVLGLYVAALTVATIFEFRRSRGAHILLLPVALATLHFSYGLGSLFGVARQLCRWTVTAGARRPSPVR